MLGTVAVLAVFFLFTVASTVVRNPVRTRVWIEGRRRY